MPPCATVCHGVPPWHKSMRIIQENPRRTVEMAKTAFSGASVPRCATVCHCVPRWHTANENQAFALRRDEERSAVLMRLARENVPFCESVPRCATVCHGGTQPETWASKSCLTTTLQRHCNDSGKSDRKVHCEPSQASLSGRTSNSLLRITLFCTVTTVYAPLPLPHKERYQGVNPPRIRGKHIETGIHD